MTSYVLMQTTGIDNSLESPFLGSEAFVALELHILVSRSAGHKKKEEKARKQATYYRYKLTSKEWHQINNS
jgi:hypothetical protein